MQISKLSYLSNHSIKKIDEKIFAGQKPTYTTLKYLKNSGVDTVIDLRAKNQITKIFLEYLKCKLLGINYFNIPIKLNKKLPTLDEFKKANNLILNSNKTFIHCNSGFHRTPLFCAASSIFRKKLSVQDTVKFLIQNKYFTTTKKKSKLSKLEQEKLKLEKYQTLNQRLKEFIKLFSSFKTT